MKTSWYVGGSWRRTSSQSAVQIGAFLNFRTDAQAKAAAIVLTTVVNNGTLAADFGGEGLCSPSCQVYRKCFV